MVSCAFCQHKLALYQKKGRGNLLIMHVEGIKEASFSFDKALICPGCEEHLGTRLNLKRKNALGYSMIRGHIHSQEI